MMILIKIYNDHDDYRIDLNVCCLCIESGHSSACSWRKQPWREPAEGAREHIVDLWDRWWY